MNGNALGPVNVGQAIQEIGGILLILEDMMISTCKKAMCQALSIQESSSKNVLFEELNKLNSKVVPSFVYPLVRVFEKTFSTLIFTGI